MIESLPVSDGVGNVPMSPLIVVAPVLVMPEPASTAKLSAVPRGTPDAAALAGSVAVSSAAPRRATQARRVARVGRAPIEGMSILNAGRGEVSSPHGATIT